MSAETLESVWADREDRVYPELFGQMSRGIFPLDGALFTGMFAQKTYDPRWLTYGVFEYAPSLSRQSWLYVTSGCSNPWEQEPADYDSSKCSGYGMELVLEVTSKGDWPIIMLRRLLAFNILLIHGRYGESKQLGYGDRVPLHAPITLEGDSELRNVVFFKPEHYSSSFRLASGEVELVHAVGITDSELAFAKEHGSEALFPFLKQNGAWPVTNPSRGSVTVVGCTPRTTR